MKLRELLTGVDVRALRGDDSVEIASVHSDSRQCGPGSLFVAVPGFAVDGAGFAKSAVDKGAAAVVAERSFELPVPSVETGDARTAAAVIAANFYGRPADRLALIGVTGTSGKTTTTKMIESILDATGEPVGLVGTIEYRAGDSREIADRTTPDAMVLQEWLSRMVAAGVPRAVMEVSSHALSLRRTYGIRFAAAVFTNLSRDHFDFHRDFEDYFAAKKILFDQIDRERASAVVNLDDEFGRRLIDELGSAALTFGMSLEADIHPGPELDSSLDGMKGSVITPAGAVRLDSPLIGRPNLANWLAAIGAALVAGIPIPEIEEGIRRLQSVRGRFERVPTGEGALLIDYAHKPDALEKLLHAVRRLAPDKRICLVVGCGGDRDRGKRPLMGEVAGRLADRTILTSDNPRSEPPGKILDEIEEGIRRVPAAEYARVVNRREAIEQAVEEMDADTVVVIAGKGHENYQVIGDRIVHFDDREEAEIAIRKKESKSDA